MPSRVPAQHVSQACGGEGDRGEGPGGGRVHDDEPSAIDQFRSNRAARIHAAAWSVLVNEANGDGRMRWVNRLSATESR